MRLLVVGESYPQSNSTTLVQAWYRFPAKAGREPVYARVQSASQPVAPGDYAGADLQEVADLQAGRYVERVAPIDDIRIDPLDTAAQTKAKVARAYQLAAARFASDEDLRLQFYGSFFDGTTVTVRGA